MSTAEAAPLIVHLIHRLDVGGLENGLVNLINHLPPERYRHAIVCLEDASDFRLRIQRPGVEIVSINKRHGKDWSHYLRLFHTLKRLQPQLIHTRNLAGIEAQLLAAAAGVRLRVHGEHGRDINDLDGSKRRYRLLRQMLRPLIGHFIAVSKDLEDWLVDTIGARPQRVTHISNGVDSVQFHPRLGPPAAIGPEGFMTEQAFVIGSVGRMAEVKDHITLVHAFLTLLAQGGLAASRMRLVIIGDGPCRQPCLDVLRASGTSALAWLPGARDDIARLMRAFTVFVQPSLAEGASNTVLEAMASGLPVVATAVGGNPELVQPGWTGKLVAPRDPGQLAAAIADYYCAPGLAAQHGARARRRVLTEFSLSAMAAAYLAVYDRLTHQPSTKG
ncbi:TIGR03088 family PEP-CTERM/XrtA system glycosyltransferase [Pseudoduganella sp. FT25W]|uniref:TIGR03088 family PEP-CTERM/XrtA system glycosyltransferase n=1 Tax=Duganella alba TaxID=2666081 RepID=A0A6L5QA85_9BURK|nr:TIGR03088 family PEP-CTERM/XrtA system glycosyltransferase [Duganella alba]MRX06448.1 TIGR03088 family PEP-CTERM/XrtA system glycosyltransferase [Duganella alba]MRX14842.1 TIGR03088 family PEP-CTERM/XrtA system glycosyltransferase [Duganella alba]